MDIYIFGAGQYGRALFQYLNMHGVSVRAFLQNGEVIDMRQDAIPIFSFRNAVEFMRDDSVICLAVRDEKVRALAKSRLIVYGISENRIIDCVQFIDENCFSGASNEVCIVCGRQSKFESFGNVTQLTLKHHVIGHGKRSHAVCPHCGCLDRIRWCIYVMAKYTNIFDSSCTVLHFAPERHIENFIRTNEKCSYITADIVQKRAMLQIDITNIPFRDETFDYLIVNHVLEHISNEALAIQELKRVLKPKGMLILSFPICMDIDTYEDANIKSDEDRLQAYGLKDHVRLYGRDFKERLSAYGITIEIKSPKDELEENAISRYGFIRDDILMICKKRET